MIEFIQNEPTPPYTHMCSSSCLKLSQLSSLIVSWRCLCHLDGESHIILFTVYIVPTESERP